MTSTLEYLNRVALQTDRFMRRRGGLQPSSDFVSFVVNDFFVASDNSSDFHKTAMFQQCLAAKLVAYPPNREGLLGWPRGLWAVLFLFPEAIKIPRLTLHHTYRVHKME
jgi:hypothetical protein